jgi:hypothetical protein
VNRGGFSWRRVVGISRAKSKISRVIGIPLTRSGRQPKLGKAMGGCLLTLLVLMISLAGLAANTLR